MTKWVGYCANQNDSCITNSGHHESETREEAIIPLAKEIDLLPGERIVIGVEVEQPIYCDGEGVADDILCWVDENLSSECGDPPSDFITDADRDDLAKRIEAAFNAWVSERNIRSHHYQFEDTTEHEVPDYLEVAE